MDSHTKQLLKDHSLRLTQSRSDIISIFLKRSVAISHGDIELAMDGKYDRVTIYRTLKSFLESGLIHKVLDDNGGARYALCNDACAGGDHKHDHIHFKCSSCEETTCLDIYIPEVSLPNGFTAKESNYLITGVCNNCSTV